MMSEHRLTTLRNTPLTRSQIEGLLISLDDYSTCEHALPYTIELSSPKRALSVFGTKHFTDPRDPQFNAICSIVERLKPTAFLVEVEPRVHYSQPWERRREFLATYAEITREESVKRSEVHLGLRLAYELDAYVEFPEASLREQFEWLHAAGFAKEHIFAYFIFRAISMWSMYRDTWSLEQLIEYRAAQLCAEWPWPEVDTSWPAVARTGEQIWGDLDLTNTDHFKLLVSPLVRPGAKAYSVISAIARRNTIDADLNIAERIQETLSRYERVFVLMGGSHVAVEEPAIRKIFESYQ